MKTSKLLLIAFILFVSILAIFFLISSWKDQPLPLGASGEEDYMHEDSIVKDIMGTDQQALVLGVNISEKTSEQIKKESKILEENTKKAIAESKMKSVSCEEIYQRFSKAMEDCFDRNNCRALKDFPDKDIAFTRCRDKSKARYDSLELKFR